MPSLPSTRTLIALALMVLLLLALVAILFITNLSFSVWEQLQDKPEWVIWAYGISFVIFSVLIGRVFWRLLIPGKSRLKRTKKITHDNTLSTIESRLEKLEISSTDSPIESVSDKSPPTLDQEKSIIDESSSLGAQKEYQESAKPDASFEMNERLASLFKQSDEVAAIRAELQEYNRRVIEKKLYIALFGDISSGKSSLINALIGKDNTDKMIETSVLGGTTREVNHYRWLNKMDDHGYQYVLTDMPGLNEQLAELDTLASNEVLRAHVVIYLCDGDLTASQFEELKQLLLLDKPCIVALNKSDRYSLEELAQILKQIHSRITPIKAQVPIVKIRAGGMREFIRLTPDGQEEVVQRDIAPELNELQEQLQEMMLRFGVDELERLREQSVASMLNRKLDDLDAKFRRSQSHRMIKSYTKKAIVAALATVSPGTDILVQGYLGIQLIKDLCKLYGVPATDIDANKLIELIQSRMDKTLPLLLAIAGNGFKAFPGIGTVTGGLMHAVAYGLIFDTLGRSIARTLEVTGELSPSLVSDLYKEQLSEDIESRTTDFIKLVLKLSKGD